MRSTITERGQTLIPAEVGRRFRRTLAQPLEWVIESDGIRVTPVQENPIDAVRERGRSGDTARLVEDRRADRDAE